MSHTGLKAAKSLLEIDAQERASHPRRLTLSLALFEDEDTGEVFANFYRSLDSVEHAFLQVLSPDVEKTL